MNTLKELKHKLYDNTSNGLDIILSYLPEASVGICKGVATKKKFKLRAENTASACLYPRNDYCDVWHIVDYGYDTKVKDPIHITAEHEHCMYNQALLRLCDRYGITNDGSNDVKPRMEFRPLQKGESEKTSAIRLAAKIPKDALAVLGPNVLSEHTDALNWHLVEYLSHVVTGDKSKHKGELCTEFSTDTYYIFARECRYVDEEGKDRKFFKIYKPQAADKAYRFSYYPEGERPEHYINGYDELKKAYDIQQALDEEDEEETDHKRRKRAKKLDCAVICCGERDSLCCRSMGYNPIWFNSETYTPTMAEMDSIRELVDTIYYIPDMDETGVRRAAAIALAHLDIKLVWLPEWLGKYKDYRGKNRKDLRDWMEICPSQQEFRNLLKGGCMAKFWNVGGKDDSDKCTISPVRLFHFLSLNGFYMIDIPGNENYELVRIEGNIVRIVTPREVKRFVSNWVKKRHLGETLQNAVYRSTLFSLESLGNLHSKEMTFKTHTATTEMFFFQKQIIEVSKDKIRKVSPNEIQDRFVWADSVMKFEYRDHEPFFRCKKIDDRWRIEILSTDSNFFRFLINSSRIYWREELEEGFETDEEQRCYCESHHFCINGERINEVKQQEQEQCLVAKIFGLGYMLHSYKTPAKPWAPFCLDYKISPEGECHGRSGKTVYTDAIKKFKKTVVLNGRDENLLKKDFSFSNVDQSTRVVVIDDCCKNFRFEQLYELITSAFIVNKKFMAAYQIEFEDSPKIMLSSNYPPDSFSPSTEARTLYEVFSDYYHVMSEDNDYIETRSVFSDLGLILFDDAYPTSCWQADCSFLMQCLQFYLSVSDTEKIMPPMSNIHIRAKKAKMGMDFEEWASEYFIADEEHEFFQNVNTLIKKKDAFDDYNAQAGKNAIKMYRFTANIKKFCEINKWKYNPPEMCTQNSRILLRDGDKIKEYMYIKVELKYRDKDGQ